MFHSDTLKLPDVVDEQNDHTHIHPHGVIYVSNVFKAKPESHYNKLSNWIRLTFLSGPCNALITRGENGLAMNIILMGDSHGSLNPCGSHSNDVCESVFVRVGGQMPMCEEMFNGDFNTTLFHAADSSVKLTDSTQQCALLPNCGKRRSIYIGVALRFGCCGDVVWLSPLMTVL